MNLKSPARSLLKQNYRIAHSYHQLRLWLEGQRNDSKIVIYQMGKVGSTSIWESLQALNLGVPIYHIHFLARQKIDQVLQKDKEKFSKQGFLFIETLQSEYLRRQLDAGIKSPWKVITLFRDPVAKELSSFFQKLQGELLLGIDYRERIAEEGESAISKVIVDRFHREYVNNPSRPHPFAWFKNELQESFDFDIFAAADMTGKDYCLFSNKKAKFLVLKLESLNVSYQSAFEDFLGIENFKLVKANVGQEKQYRSLYKQFLREVNLPDSYLSKMYHTDLVRHFYSESEIQQFYQRWSAG